MEASTAGSQRPWLTVDARSTGRALAKEAKRTVMELRVPLL